MNRTLNDHDVDHILKEYSIPPVIKIMGIQSGHINDSYQVITQGGTFFLQKINHQVFYPVEKLMQNYSQILSFLHSENTFPTNVQVLLTKNAASYVFDKISDSYWRITTYVVESQSYNKAVDDQMAYDAGSIIASFHNSSIKLDPKNFYTILPDFHNLDLRYHQWLTAEKEDPMSRVKGLAEESTAIKKLISILSPVHSAIVEGEIRQFVVHNDTKLNNILFDKNRNGLTMIDWDTVMSGTLLYDFGDCLRNIGSNLEEDGKQLEDMIFQLNYYKSFSTGYLDNLQFDLTSAEFTYLPYAPIYMTMLMCIRFLTDYLLGDIYYKTTYPGQNLARGRNQLLLAQKMVDALDEMTLTD